MGMMIMNLLNARASGCSVSGTCAKCGAMGWESLLTLDDCYNVWAGRCHACGAINLLATTSMRGYSSQGMDLVLPTDEEVAANPELPKDTPSSGACGKPANLRGSISGELGARLREDFKKQKGGGR